MLTIRNEQLTAFRDQTEQRFIVRLTTYLREQFPEETRELEEAALQAQVKRELIQARAFQLRSQRDLYLYLNLSLLFGQSFLERAEHHWMQHYLTDRGVPHPGERMRRLYAAARRKLEIAANNHRVMEDFKKLRGRV